jgi:hypothetical protein
MAFLKKLSTARKNVIIDGIETVQSQVNSKDIDINANSCFTIGY